MDVHVDTTPSGERFVRLPEADSRALVAAAEDGADRAALADFRRRFAAGEEELIPAAIVDRLLSGDENRVRVWREYRGLTAVALAERAGIAQADLSQIETGRREGTIETLRKLADALGVSLDEIAG